MKRLGLIMLAVMVFLFAGCAPTVTIWPVEPERTEVFNSTEVEGVQERTAGEPLLLYALNALSRPGFVASREFQPPPDTTHSPMGLYVPPIKKGSEWVAFGRVSEAEGGGYICKNVNEIPLIRMSLTLSWEMCLLVDKDGAAYGTAFCEDETTGWMRLYEYHRLGRPLRRSSMVYLCDDPIRYGNCVEVDAPDYLSKLDRKAKRAGASGVVFIQKWDDPQPKGFLETKKMPTAELVTGRSIIYTGKTGSLLSFTYREWPKQDMVLTYDLAESKTIVINGIEFEVIEATGSNIRFRITTPLERLKGMMDEDEKRFMEKAMKRI
ncbi:MAG: hypothetical protein HY894_07930 [Deltaproteobacteria bacterium]|nr:hypothetical protein [Deltaproteobacteria bacterium]